MVKVVEFVESVIEKQIMSDLMDGHGGTQGIDQAVGRLGGESSLQTWDTYHLIGDVLRQGAPAVQSVDVLIDTQDFVARLRQRLQHEPVPMLMPGSESASASGVILQEAVITTTPFSQRHEAANTPWYGTWSRVAVAATLAVVAIGAWPVLMKQGDAPAHSLVAVKNNPVTSVDEAPNTSSVMLRDPHLDALLAAHRQAGGASALQMPAGFLRNATYEGNAP